MLQIDQLTIRLRKDQRTLIENFQYSLGDRQQKIALIGEEGNGKSTFLKALYQPELLAPYADIEGTIQTTGEKLGYLPQILGEDWQESSVSEVFHETIPWDRLDYNLCYRLCQQLGVDPDLLEADFPARQLSGGEKIRFALLLLLLQEPSILLLDEPSNDLDLASVEMLEYLIQNFPGPIFFISHDERLLEACATTIIHFEQLVHKTQPVFTVKAVPYRTYVAEREASIQKQNQLAGQEKRAMASRLAAFQRQKNQVEHALRSTKNDVEGRLLAKKMHSVQSVGRRLDKAQEDLTQKRIVEEAIDLTFDEDISLPNNQTVLDLDLPTLEVGGKVLSRNVTLSVRGPEKICIVGPNGSGKTTLLHEILRALEDRPFQVAYMPQSYVDELDLTKSPVEFLTKDHTKDEHTRIRTYLGSLNYTPEEMLRPLGGLSGGQQAKLYFAKMIFSRAQVLVLDEPTRNLSPLSGPQIRAALKDYPGGILAVSHDRVFIDAVFDKVYELTPDGLIARREASGL